jgi:hypothetical protein
MRIFIGFKYKSGDGTLSQVPVSYGDMTRQVAAIIKENSENKLPTVPKISCYITGIELDTTRLADASFVSKVPVRERSYDIVNGERIYGNDQGAAYTVERLMPTPFKLSMKADIWTSNTDQKLQLFEQIMVLFNPSLEIQTTDNYLDWTSLTVVNLAGTNFSSRTIPVGADSEIDILSISFDIPIYLTPPAKVKRLGVVRAVISNIFSDQGDVVDLSNLIFNGGNSTVVNTTIGNYGILVLKANNGQPNDYEVTVVNANQAVRDLGLELPPDRVGSKIDWSQVFEQYGDYVAGVSRIFLKQSNGFEIVGTIAINPVDSTVLIATLDPDTVQTNTAITSGVYPAGKGTIDAIINPYNFNPVSSYGSKNNFPVGLRYLMLDDVNIGFRSIRLESVTNVITTDIDFYRIIPQDPSQPLGNSNAPVAYRNVHESTVFVNGVAVSFTEKEDGGRFTTTIDAGNFVIGQEYMINSPGNTDWFAIGAVSTQQGTRFTATGIGSGSGNAMAKTESGKYKIVLDSMPPLTDVSTGEGTVIKYVVKKYSRFDWKEIVQGDDPSTVAIETEYEINKNQPDLTDGPDAWKNLNGSDIHIAANSVIEWDGVQWNMIFDPESTDITHVTNLRTGIQYKWNGTQWLKSFEGEYVPGSWRFDLDP